MLKEILGLHALDKMGSQERQLDRQTSQINGLQDDLDRKNREIQALQNAPAPFVPRGKSSNEVALEDEVVQLRELLAKPLWEIAAVNEEFRKNYDASEIRHKDVLLEQLSAKQIALELGALSGKSSSEIEHLIATAKSALTATVLTEDDKARIQRKEAEAQKKIEKEKIEEEQRRKNIQDGDAWLEETIKKHSKK